MHTIQLQPSYAIISFMAVQCNAKHYFHNGWGWLSVSPPFSKYVIRKDRFNHVLSRHLMQFWTQTWVKVTIGHVCRLKIWPLNSVVKRYFAQGCFLNLIYSMHDLIGLYGLFTPSKVRPITFLEKAFFLTSFLLWMDRNSGYLAF